VVVGKGDLLLCGRCEWLGGKERGELVVGSWCSGGVGMDVSGLFFNRGGCDVVLVPGVGRERLRGL